MVTSTLRALLTKRSIWSWGILRSFYARRLLRFDFAHSAARRTSGHPNNFLAGVFVRPQLHRFTALSDTPAVPLETHHIRGSQSNTYVDMGGLRGPAAAAAEPGTVVPLRSYELARRGSV